MKIIMSLFSKILGVSPDPVRTNISVNTKEVGSRDRQLHNKITKSDQVSSPNSVSTSVD